MNILEAMNWRYATKRMTQQKVSDQDIITIAEAIRLSPSAYGLQPYSIIITENRELMNQIFEKACPQPVVQQCSHLIIFKTQKKVTDSDFEQYLNNMQQMRQLSEEQIDKYRSRIAGAVNNDSINNFAWTTQQTYLAMGVATVIAAELQIDSTPIEGFSPDQLNKILKLDTEKESTTLMLTLGYRDEAEDHLCHLPKIRKSKEEFIQQL